MKSPSLLLLLALAAGQSHGSEVVLNGTLASSDAPGYRMLPFTVPAGTHRIEVRLDKTGQPAGVMATLGLYGPLAYRGMGRSEFVVATHEATTPFQAGPIEPGSWQVLLAVSHIPAGLTWQYRIVVATSSRVDPPPAAPLRTGAAWYTGDLHSHTGHSDGSCPGQNGRIVPCPPYRLVQAAAEQGLDFLAITDHNTASTLNSIRELQPAFDRLLLIHGREITTHAGHSNLWGTAAAIDFRIGFQGWTANDYLRQARAAGGVVSINHPHWPISPDCPGCGWGWKDQTDFALVDAVETVNGYRQQNSRFHAPPGNGIAFWEDLLRKGFRPTAVGGGDDHESGMGLPASGVGLPRVEVYASELSEPAILAAVRAGHVYVKAEGARSPDLRLEVRTVDSSGQARVSIVGDNVPNSPGARAKAMLRVQRGAGSKVRLLWDGETLAGGQWLVEGSPWTAEVELPALAGRHWLRAEVLDPQGTLLTMSNPVYFAFETR